MQVTLGFSSCPNDTFIFDALLHGKIDTEGLTFIPVIEDVESLNKKALNAQLDNFRALESERRNFYGFELF